MRDVLVLNQFALPRSEGGGTRHVDLFGRLNSWNVLIVAGNRNHYSQQAFTTNDSRFSLIRVPQTSGGPVARLTSWLIFSLGAIVVGLRQRNVDVVVGSSPQPLGAMAALLIARLRRVPFVLEVRDLWPESAVSAGRLRPGGLGYKIFRKIEHVLTKNASRIICVTDGWEDHFAELGTSSEALVVISNGSEPADFWCSTPRSVLRERYGVHGFTAVFAGAHGPKDGIDLILDAAQRLPDMRFMLVGSGTVKADGLERAHRQGLGNVEFRPPVPKEVLAELLRACDVGIHAVSPLPVFAQGMSPNKLFDYMACELPVVSNAQGALARIMIDGECGRLGESTELVRCLTAVMGASDDERRQWGRRSVEIINQHYSRSAAAVILGRTLDQVREDRRGPRETA